MLSHIKRIKCIQHAIHHTSDTCDELHDGQACDESNGKQIYYKQINQIVRSHPNSFWHCDGEQYAYEVVLVDTKITYPYIECSCYNIDITHEKFWNSINNNIKRCMLQNSDMSIINPLYSCVKINRAKIISIVDILTRNHVQKSEKYSVGNIISNEYITSSYENAVNFSMISVHHEISITKYIQSFGQFDDVIEIKRYHINGSIKSINEYNCNGQNHGLSLKYKCQSEQTNDNIKKMILPEYNVPNEYINDFIIFYGRYTNGHRNGDHVEYERRCTSVIKYEMGITIYPEQYYDINGTLFYTIFDRKKIDGHTYETKSLYYDDGSIATIENLIDGERNGKYIEYDGNGNTEFVTYFKKDKIHGRRIDYVNNIPNKISLWKNDVCVVENYDPDKPFIKTEYYANKNLKCEESYNEDDQKHGDCKYYNENGTITEFIIYNNDKKHGDCKYYNKNGTIAEFIMYNNDKKHGDCKYYNKDGKLTKYIKYDNDVIQDEKHYDEKERLKQLFSYNNGQKNGKSIKYDYPSPFSPKQDGNNESKPTYEHHMFYKNDLLDGPCVSYKFCKRHNCPNLFHHNDKDYTYFSMYHNGKQHGYTIYFDEKTAYRIDQYIDDTIDVEINYADNYAFTDGYIRVKKHLMYPIKYKTEDIKYELISKNDKPFFRYDTTNVIGKTIEVDLSVE